MPASSTQLRIVIAPDSFKGSIRASEAARALAAGWRRGRPGDALVLVPMADGGEGTLEAFAAAIPAAKRMPVEVEGPTGRPVASSWLYLEADAHRPTTGIVELACTAGIELVPHGEPLQPLEASSYGFGRAIRAALDHGVTRLVLAIGSSASSDGGTGVLEALGAAIRDAQGRPVERGARGLTAIADIDVSAMAPPPADGAIVLTDVDSGLLGPRGAAAVFGPQKGATPADVERIEAGLRHWAGVLGGDCDAAGAGAAGGVGYALMRWGAVAEPGSKAVAQLVGLDGVIAGADLVITGEGSFDEQSAAGKAPAMVLASAARHGVPAVVVAGRIAARPDEPIETIALTDLAGSGEAALAEPQRWLEEAGTLLASRASGAARPAILHP